MSDKKRKKPVPLFCTFPMAADRKGPDGKVAPSEESVEQVRDWIGESKL